MPEEQGGASGSRFRLPVARATKQTAGQAAGQSSGQAAAQAADANLPAIRDSSTPAQVTHPGMANLQNVPGPGGGPGPITPTVLSQQISSQTGQIAEEVSALRADVQLLHEAFLALSDRESHQEKVFNVLHKELGDYKNDFIYEHLKPVIRPLLFLFDSLEQFEEEVLRFERPDTEERRQVLNPRLVHDNIHYFRDQLIEALLVIEVTLMERPTGQFDPKLHKAVDVVEVPPEQDNTIQRVVRSGFYLRDQLFRPAEVVVGRSR